MKKELTKEREAQEVDVDDEVDKISQWIKEGAELVKKYPGNADGVLAGLDELSGLLDATGV